MDRLILNCDLGENESTAKTAALLSCVDAANICCGVHAGSEEKLIETLGLAAEQNVMVGAHPGMPSAGGRGNELPSMLEFSTLLREQMGHFMEQANRLSVDVSYVKLHGCLYNGVEKCEELCQEYLSVMKRDFSNLAIFSLAGGACARMAQDLGMEVYHEVFADRTYQKNGELVSRSAPGALIEKVDVSKKRIQEYIQYGYLESIDGSRLYLPADTCCVHSDSEKSIELLEGLGEIL